MKKKVVTFTDGQLETIVSALRIYAESLRARLINDPCGTSSAWINGQIAGCGDIEKLLK